VPEGAAYDRVRRQLTSIVERFDLKESEPRILRTYSAICDRSLAFPLGPQLPTFSRINNDGTPIQIATTLGAPFRVFQFVSETGWPGASGSERLRAGRECITTVARLLDADAPLQDVASLLSELVPENDPELLADPAGALWIGAAFASTHHPRLRVYVNGSWGRQDDQWVRLDRFASHFCALEAWREARKILPPEMKPLGSAVTLAREAAATGRIYVIAYGKLVKDYEKLARAVSGDRFAEALRQYAECLLGEDRCYPTPTVVCSFGLATRRDLDFKIELCSHCLYPSDAEASDRLRSCLDAAGVDTADYLHLLEVLTEGELNNSALELHSYAGIGVRDGESYFPVYLKPKLVQ
jgi:hypothetical protein